MWNLLYQNPICFKKKTAQDQLKHITTIQTAKSCLHLQPPWQSTHSLQKLSNKYTHIQDLDIVNQNLILMSKMKEIQKKKTSFKIPTSYASIDNLRKKETTKIIQENQTLLKRLQSAHSQYPVKFLKKDNERLKQYRENLQKTKSNSQNNKGTYNDFNVLAQQEFQRKLLYSSQSQRKFLQTSERNRQNTCQTVPSQL
ncbi:unnamed protein product [Paramecium pentaurelia]|uniref:Uncharacterized protein n=1 Tax=Paramecium pentaurelia TaxID=43138 RepID=A0A8S1U7B5_9CILI|nr:unnamed protein product [Paramecium pentaurelia]